jgi:hypothetical protein
MHTNGGGSIGSRTNRGKADRVLLDHDLKMDENGIEKVIFTKSPGGLAVYDSDRGSALNHV